MKYLFSPFVVHLGSSSTDDTCSFVCIVCCFALSVLFVHLRCLEKTLLRTGTLKRLNKAKLNFKKLY